MKRIMMLLAMAALVMSGLPAFAQGHGQGRSQGMGQGLGQGMGQGMPGQPSQGQPGQGQGMMSGSGFTVVDRDNDGRISQEEFQQSFEQWDRDESGYLDRSEWQHGHGQLAAGQGVMGMSGWTDFQEMDADGDGSVSVEEFQAHHPRLGQQDMALIDTDKDGKISEQEWQRLRQAHGGAQGGMMGGAAKQ